MADNLKKIETVVDLLPEPASTYFKAELGFLEFVGYFSDYDPVAAAVNELQKEINQIRADINLIDQRLNGLAERMAYDENDIRLHRLQDQVDAIDRVQFQIGQKPGDANARGLIARDAGAIADKFLDDLDLWNWTDIQVTYLYDQESGVLVNTVEEPMTPDFKSFPALPVYVSAVATWLTAIDLDTGGNFQLVQQRYGNQLRRHMAQVSVRAGWSELDQPAQTLPEQIIKRITCYPDALDQFADHDGNCHYTILCNNVMDRRTTPVDNSDYSVHFAEGVGTLCTANPNAGITFEREIEGERGVTALTGLCQLLAQVESTGTLRQPFIGTFDATPTFNRCFIYAAKPDGTLEEWKQLPSPHADALAGWNGPFTVGHGWHSFTDVFPAGGNCYYALTPEGKLLWYQHNGFSNGVMDWKQKDAPVGSGWNQFSKVFSGSDGVLYAVQPDGVLRWYKDDGFRTGAALWRNYVPQKNGWNAFKTIFSTGNGVIYAVRSDGALLRYHHLGFADGSVSWVGPHQVHQNWQNYSHIFSVGEGVIYAIQPDGKMFWYQDTHWDSDDPLIDVVASPGDPLAPIGAGRWKGPLPAGSGWTAFRYVFPLMQATPEMPH